MTSTTYCTVLHSEDIRMDGRVLRINTPDGQRLGFNIDPETMTALGLDLIAQGLKMTTAIIREQEALLDHYRGAQEADD